jgi:serine/threonine-protein kinase SRPK3
MIDTFEHKGPHGRHVCMVFEVLGDNLLSLIRHYDHNGIPLAIVKKLSKEILEGLAFLHDTCKVIHTDLKPENVMLKRSLKKRQELAIERAVESYKKDPVAWKNQKASKLAMLVASGKKLSKNQKKKLRKKMQKQREEDKGEEGASSSHQEGQEHRRSAELSRQLEGLDMNLSDDMPVEKQLMEMECKIVDFGNACWVDKHFTEEIQTRQYRSPEVCHVQRSLSCYPASNDHPGHQVSSLLPVLVALDIVSMAKSDTGGFATSGVRRDDDQITFFAPNTIYR